jgi:hypothetical protein
MMAATATAPAKTVTADFAQVGNVAHVNFRVRCEGLGHGEEVFLVEGTTSSTNKVRYHVMFVSPSGGRCVFGSTFARVEKNLSLWMPEFSPWGTFLINDRKAKSFKRDDSRQQERV